MYFKQLELFGFKSFAQKTSLELEKGVSAIVGPNGCGKSNIADAIRWVLGEQKMRVLRGQHMEDVIFNGSDDRHPLGMAEVTLVLDNSSGKLPVDYSEVSLTRRLFRSGESEYYMNKLPCRRKDIVELVMGTGIGADSYSLIEQGRIDLLLSSKPEERRYIFEDAAGIIKYRSRKDAAMRKLERSDANLLRLQDTIVEVRRRINSLKRQASAAERYRRYREELRGLELQLALLRYRRLDGEQSELARRARELQARLEELTAKQATEESEVEKARLELLEREKVLFRSQDQSRDYQSQIEKAESQIALFQEKISAIDERERRGLSEIEELKLREEKLRVEHDATSAKEREASQKASAAQCELAEKEEQLGRLNEVLEDCERGIEHLRSAALEKLNRRVNLQNELGALEANLEAIAKRIIRLSERKVQVDQSVSQFETRLSETRNMIHSLRAALASLSSDVTLTNETIVLKQQDLESALTAREEIRDALSAARSKLSSLEELREKFEGYEEGVRTIMRARQQGEPCAAGVVGTLAELVHARREYEAAVGAALDHRLQHIVVEDVVAARGCASLLQTNGVGRASFIPLSLFNSNGHSSEPDSQVEGVIGKAMDLISCDGRIRGIAEAFLGKTLVVDSLDTAFGLRSNPESGLNSGRYDFVTLKGEAVSAIGCISAGDAGERRGLLGRKNEIEELKNSVERMTEEADAESARIAGLRQDIEHSNELLEKLHGAVTSHEVELAKAERDMQQLGEGKKREEQERDVLAEEQSLALSEQQELTKQRQELLLQIEHAANVEAETKEQLRGEAERLNDFRNRKEVLAAEITNFKVSVSSLELTCKSFRHELSRLESEIQEADRRIAEKRREIAEGSEARRDFACKADDARALIQRIFEQKRALDLEIGKLEDQRRQLAEKIEVIEGNLKNTRSLLQEVGDEHHRAEIDLAQTQQKITFLKEQTLSEYRLSLSEVAQEFTIDDGFDSETASEEAQRLRAKIESMGAVNLIAIEEFEELQQRYNFLIQQEDDLRKAREALLGIIKKINETTQTMFLDTFNQIREHFHEIFRHLFGGGRANVHLVDPDNPLESGIEISVHPPGKKAQNISILSGGEKALTAISLLFAIFRTKPSPFCVLDEVDAALDDSNILRFARLVKMFSQDVQFIIITHNKRTMELADVLFGITMEERGVSQIVSVQLRKATAFEFLEPAPA